MELRATFDLWCSIVLWGTLAAVLAASKKMAILEKRLGHERLLREEGLPLVGKGPMHAVYTILLTVGRGLARWRVSPNSVTLSSLGFATIAGILFANGLFGAGTALTVVAALADAVDGIVARESGRTSRFGQVLDTTIDRYVEAAIVCGMAICMRGNAWLLALSLGALVGSFMVSYASSVLRELSVDDHGAPMRRAHRMAYVIVGASLVPAASYVSPASGSDLRFVPIALAFGAIAIVGNVSAVRRLLRASRAHEPPRTAVGPVTAARPSLHLPQPSESHP